VVLYLRNCQNVKHRPSRFESRFERKGETVASLNKLVSSSEPVLRTLKGADCTRYLVYLAVDNNVPNMSISNIICRQRS